MSRATRRRSPARRASPRPRRAPRRRRASRARAARGSSAKPPERVGVDRVEVLVDAHRQHRGDTDRHEQVEEDADLDEERQPERRDQPAEEDPVLDGDEADELGDRLAPRRHEQDADERQRQRYRKRARRGIGGRELEPPRERESRGRPHVSDTRRHRDGGRDEREQGRLDHEEPHAGHQATHGDAGERRREQRDGERVDDGRRVDHPTTSSATSARTASAEAAPRSSGSLRMRSLALADSTTAITAASSRSFAPNAAIARGASRAARAMPNGTKSAMSSENSVSCFTSVAHTSTPSGRPEYSISMPSWIIVSSRCVSGLSAGTRPVSAMTATNMATSASSWLGARTAAAWSLTQRPA